MKQDSQLKFYAIDEPVDTVEDETADMNADAAKTIAVSTQRKGSTKLRKLARVTLIAVLIGVLTETVLGIYSAFQASFWLGSLWLVISVMLCLTLFGFFIREWWLLRKLKQRWQMQTHFDEQSHIRALQRPDLEQQWQQQRQSHWTDTEVTTRFEHDILAKVDQTAVRRIRKWSLEAAALVAISPSSLADMLLLLWRNQRMISELSQLYGVKLGYWSRIKLWRQILTNLAYAGVSELIVDMGSQWLSTELVARLSARAAQGVGAGLLTARLGLQTIRLVRPLPYVYTQKPSLLSMQKLLVKDLAKQFPTMFKGKSDHAPSQNSQSL
ncbi:MULTISPECIES: TIGR01620 family protein [unclassified Idiomarina]|uniref:TIGR01620 family protein n=1 Tax=unclassified Idiomarina TaxID=2614829 RepID=UPI000C8F5BF8|nr:TIGR01620 family protein [Idiomarina sp. UBA3162]MAD54398.1 TIGR01620 family protein [Idiomarinaceae bacterium]MEC7642062.1 TIGR01620 family protein [Pseudomonadota bacterium]